MYDLLPEWGWRVLIFGGIALIFILAIYTAVGGYKAYGPTVKTARGRKWQLAFFFVVLALFAGYMFDLADTPLSAQIGGGLWFGISAMLAPKEVSYRAVFIWLAQVLGLAALLIAFLLWHLGHL
jgi:hypothetical protein